MILGDVHVKIKIDVLKSHRKNEKTSNKGKYVGRHKNSYQELLQGLGVI